MQKPDITGYVKAIYRIVVHAWKKIMQIESKDDIKSKQEVENESTFKKLNGDITQH